MIDRKHRLSVTRQAQLLGLSRGASRMQTAAGSIAVSEATRNLCEGYFILKPLGTIKFKGVSEPVSVYEVTGLGPLRTRFQRAAGRGLTKFVGREAELAQMRRALEAAREGHGQIVAVTGEPGVGKSACCWSSKPSRKAIAWCWRPIQSRTAEPSRSSSRRLSKLSLRNLPFAFSMPL